MSNYLITGSSGLIASEIIKQLIEKEKVSKIYCQSRNMSFPDHLEPYKKNIIWFKHDLSETLPNKILNKIDVIIHLSAQTSVYKARENIYEDLKANFFNGIKLLESIKNKNIFFVLAGSATQIGYTNGEVIDSPVSKPETFYDLNKTFTELYLNQFIREGWLTGCTLKLANVYGARLNSQSLDRGIIDMIYRKAKNNENIEIYGGNFYRDYVHIEDVAAAFIKATKRIKSVNNNSYIIASGESIKLMDAFNSVIKLAIQGTKNNPKVSYKKMPKNYYLQESRSVFFDISSAKRDLKWTPKINFYDGIKKTYENK